MYVSDGSEMALVSGGLKWFALVPMLAFAGCSSIADIPVVGLPEGAPPRAAQAPPFPAVHDMPQDRNERPLTPDEQALMERSLKDARDKQNGVAKAVQKSSAGGPSPDLVKPPSATP